MFSHDAGHAGQLDRPPSLLGPGMSVLGGGLEGALSVKSL